jgi:hypothetical protein
MAYRHGRALPRGGGGGDALERAHVTRIHPVELLRTAYTRSSTWNESPCTYFRLCGVALLDHHSRSAGRETQAQVFCELRGFVDVIAPPTEVEGDLFSEINNNSVAILLTYGTARILLAGNAEANEKEYRVNGPYARP